MVILFVVASSAFAGSLITWGFDDYVANTPAGTDFVDIAAGNAHCLALKNDNSIVAWGNDSYGQVSNTPSGKLKGSDTLFWVN